MPNQQLDFNSAAGLTFDPAVLEVAGGSAQLVSSGGLPSDLTLYAQFNSLVNFDAFFAVGSPTATENNSPQHDAITKKFGAASMDLSAAVVGRGIRYPAAGNAVWSQTGAVAFQFQPNYTGLPGGVPNNYFFHLWDISGPFTANEVGLWHDAGTGVIHLVAADQAGTNIGGDFNVWSPTAGQFYHHEVNCRFSAPAAQRHFIDGVALGPTLAGIGTVNGAARDFVYVGTEEGFTNGSGGWYDEFQIYNTVQHVANFTPPSSELGAATFPTTSPAMVADAVVARNLIAFADLATEPVGTSITYAIRMRGYDYFFYEAGAHWSSRVSSMANVEFSCSRAQIAQFIRFLRPDAPYELVIYFNGIASATPSVDQIVLEFN